MNFNSASFANEYDATMSSDEEAHTMTEMVFNQFQKNQNQIMKNLLGGQSSNTSNGGSVAGHNVVYRDREGANYNMYLNYFCDKPIYDDDTFQRRYRLNRELFLRICTSVKNHDRYFLQRPDAVGRLGFSTQQKITAAMRILALGIPADALDESTTVAESTALESLRRFCRAIVEIFSAEFLRSPNATDIARLLHIGKSRGFPGMLGSLDCMHWKWKACPTAWHGQFSGRSGTPSIILEAVADYDLWIWHAYFGMPGSNNDINVLDRSNLFSNLANGIAPPVNYTIGGKEFNMGYYLADGIYPKWSTIVQTIKAPLGRKNGHFAKMQEACRKDVERAFGVLQSRFAIIANPVRFWRKSQLHDIMKTCIILHNMIIEDSRDVEEPIPRPAISEETNEDEDEVQETNVQFEEFIRRHRQIRDETKHFELRNALIDHLWEEYSN